MSLVNKMLRDLDARRVGDGERAALPAAVTPLAARAAPQRTLLRQVPALLLVLAALGGAGWYGARTMRSDAPAVPPAAAVAVPAAPVAVAPPPVTAAPLDPNSAASASTLPSLRMADELIVVPVPAEAPEPPRKTPAATPMTAPRPAAETIPPKAAVTAQPKVPPVLPEGRIDKQPRLPSAAERVEAEYRRGLLAQRQGNAEEAAAAYRAALAEQAEHAAARQALAALLIEGRRFDEAEEVLLKGMEQPSLRLPSTLTLARLKVERNQAGAALELLQKNAAAGERSAEYHGFTAALLNRAGRMLEAVEHYQAATRLAPNEGRWWAGLGIALDAAGKGAEAREAYQKARGLPGLPADLAQHIEQRLR